MRRPSQTTFGARYCQPHKGKYSKRRAGRNPHPAFLYCIANVYHAKGRCAGYRADHRRLHSGQGIANYIRASIANAERVRPRPAFLYCIANVCHAKGRCAGYRADHRRLHSGQGIANHIRASIANAGRGEIPIRRFCTALLSRARAANHMQASSNTLPAQGLQAH